MSVSFALRGLTSGYGGRTVIDGLDLQPVPAGSLVAVVGPNAVGKSTLLKAIAGLRPSRGQILLGERDLAALTPRERLREAGYLPQALPQASSLVVYEALLSALRAGRPELSGTHAEQAIESVLQSLGLHELALRQLNELSGGQRQMVGLAQVIVREPRLLLLDEPTSALDLRWQLSVIEAVRALVARRGSIVLVAIHDLNLALRFCDRIVVLGREGLLAQGAPAEVVDAALLRRAYGVEARVEHCSFGQPLVLADRALPLTNHFPHEINP